MDIVTSLATWNNLNAAVMKADEAVLSKLLEAELSGKRRKMFLLRIQSRVNRIRAERERATLRRAAE